ncbi:GNAT family N-acetyltransferase [Anaerotignum sp.]|uniref:GNAT family N-acetyltransferase n=1 Tax=Anaerotignum sp. TaxID=2039241 RepID=UPI002714B09B|nr:GNAT family N-acetyltransferase [Anaerotignum sp.]
MFFIDQLEEKDIKDYILFTFPCFREKLEEFCVNEGYVVLAASYHLKPAGLLLARLNSSKKAAVIRSIYVVTAYRRQGLGTKLLQEGEKVLREKGCKELQICFPMDESHFSPLSETLKKNEWSSFVKFSEICKFKVSDYSWIFHSPFKRGAEAIPFDDITSEQRTYVNNGIGKWYPAYASPFLAHLRDYHKDTSFWLCLNGEIIGWMVTVLVAKDTISFERMYLREEFQRTFLSIPFVSYICRKQLSLNIPYSSMLINYSEPYVNPPLKSFYERKIKPYTILHKEYYISNKLL